MNYYLTMKSSNSKVGKIPVTTASQKTCEQSNCSLLKNGGCYAMGGPMSWFWKRVTDGTAKNVTNLKKHLEQIREIKAGSCIRLFQAGQLSHNKKGKLNRNELSMFIAAVKHLNPICYVHTEDSESVRLANSKGFPLIASLDSFDQLDNFKGCPTSHVIDWKFARQGTIRNGFSETLSEWRSRIATDLQALREKFQSKNVKLVLCPAQYLDDMNCDKCKICTRLKPDEAIAFAAHGKSKKKIS